MASHTLALQSGYCAIELVIDENRIFGNALPALCIVGAVLLRYPFRETGRGMELRKLRCRFAVGEKAYLTQEFSFSLENRVHSEFRESKEQFYLEIPLSHQLIARLERFRNGDEMKLRLDINIDADELIELGRESDGNRRRIWGVVDHETVPLRMPLYIPRDVWLSALPQMEYGKIFLVELPVVPIESCSVLKGSYEALQQGHDFLLKGYYDDAVGKCRVALEPFFERIVVNPENPDSRSVYVLKSSWEKRLGLATYTWLNSAFSAIKAPTNRPHHSADQNFDQLDTQMLLAVTTSVISYAVRAKTEQQD